MRITAEEIQKRANCLKTVQIFQKCRIPETDYSYTYTYTEFRILPEKKDYPFISLIFDEDIEFIDSVCFSEWHAHFDEYEDEGKNIEAALKFTEELVKNNYYLTEEYDRECKYICGKICRKSEDVKTEPHAKLLKRIYFNMPVEEIKIENRN